MGTKAFEDGARDKRCSVWTPDPKMGNSAAVMRRRMPVVDDAALRRSLEASLGPDKIRMDEASRHAYSTDSSPCAVEPRAVAFAESESDVLAVLRSCREHEVPLTPCASGTSLSGAAIGPGIVLDTTCFRRIFDFDARYRIVQVGPGLLLSELNPYLAERGVRFAPDPGSQDLSPM